MLRRMFCGLTIGLMMVCTQSHAMAVSNTGIFDAIMAGDIELLQKQLAWNYNIRVFGYNAMLFGCDINMSDMSGATPLHWAASRGRVDMLQELLRRRAFVDAQDRFKMTPLHWAASLGYTPAVLALVQAKADLGLQDSYDQTAAQLARERGYARIADYLEIACQKRLAAAWRRGLVESCVKLCGWAVVRLLVATGVHRLFENGLEND